MQHYLFMLNTCIFSAQQYVQVQNWISASKRKNDFQALFQRDFKRKVMSTKLQKSADKSCSHSNTIYNPHL